MAEIGDECAGRIFLLMGKEYRISRSIRAQWFFQHINSPVYSKCNQDLVCVIVVFSRDIIKSRKLLSLSFCKVFFVLVIVA